MATGCVSSDKKHLQNKHFPTVKMVCEPAKLNGKRKIINE